MLKESERLLVVLKGKTREKFKRFSATNKKAVFKV